MARCDRALRLVELHLGATVTERADRGRCRLVAVPDPRLDADRRIGSLAGDEVDVARDQDVALEVTGRADDHGVRVRVEIDDVRRRCGPQAETSPLADREVRDARVAAALDAGRVDDASGPEDGGIAALEESGITEEKLGFCSTGGGAMLEFLVKGTLPGIAALG